MVHSHREKFERVTITLLPTADDRSFRHVPSTFDVAHRRYSWRHYETLNYMIVPKKISGNEIKVDMFIGSGRKKQMQPAQLHKVVEELVNAKMQTEWTGLKLAGISRATAAVPPAQTIVRGTIEEILGADLNV